MPRSIKRPVVSLTYPASFILFVSLLFTTLPVSAQDTTAAASTEGSTTQTLAEAESTNKPEATPASSDRNLPLLMEISVLPDTSGGNINALLQWRWNAQHSSTLKGNWTTTSSSGPLSGYSTDSLYALNQTEGTLHAMPWSWGGSLGSFGWSAAPGLSFSVESLRERGNYQDMGVQVYDNLVNNWRLGPLAYGGISGGFGPLSADLELSVIPALLYWLSQEQSSSLIAESGSLETWCLTGPEIITDIRLALFDWFWVSANYNFIWLSVPRLVQNEAHDAWTTLISGSTNHSLRALAGVDLPAGSGSLRLGLGWKQIWSISDSGTSAVLDSGLIFELVLKTGTREE